MNLYVWISVVASLSGPNPTAWRHDASARIRADKAQGVGERGRDIGQLAIGNQQVPGKAIGNG